MKAEILKRIKENKDWYNKSYSGYFFGIYEQGMGITHEGQENPFMGKYLLMFQNFNTKDHFDTFWGVPDMREKREMLINEVTTNPVFLNRIYSEWKPRYEGFVKVFDEIAFVDKKSLSNDELKNNLLKLHNALLDSCRWSYTVDALLSNEADGDWLVKEIVGELGEKATNQVIETLTSPHYSSFVDEAHFEILKIAKAIKEENKEMVNQLSFEFYKKYFWFRTNYKSFIRFTDKDTMDEAGKEVDEKLEDKIRAQENRVLNNRKNKSELFKDLNVSERLQNIIKLSELFTFLQDKRKEKVLRMNILCYEMLEEIGKRFNIKDNLQFYFTIDEIIKLFDTQKYDLEILKKRYDEGFLSIYSNDSCDIYYKDSYDEICDINSLFPKNDDVKSFKGSVAYKGKVTGHVRVLKTVEDIKSFEEGQILVANQTTPEFVPAMKKAIAIITDQGGITCHAAIVSRELKLPAIIGTKIATKVLKDGDLVEVDAETGIVTILNK